PKTRLLQSWCVRCWAPSLSSTRPPRSLSSKRLGTARLPRARSAVAASYAEARPEMVELARRLRRPDLDRRPISLRRVAAALAERGYVASTGRPYEAAAIASMLRE